VEQPEIDTSMTKILDNVNYSPISQARTKTPPVDEDQQESKSPEHTETSPSKESQEPVIEHLYTGGCLGNTLTWGDQQIPKPVDEIVDIHAITYDRKSKFVMRRTTNKKRLMLNSTLLITIEETLLNIENAKIVGCGA
jgi:hypothetical protein